MKIIKKLDDYLFAGISAMVIRWVKKNKYTKHKYDFFISMQCWELSYWVGAILFQVIHALWFGKHGMPPVAAIVLTVFLGVVVFGEWVQLSMLKDQKEHYDQLWLRRKNPIVYQVVKETCEALKEDMASQRRFILVFNVCTLILFIFWNSILTPIYLFLIVGQYKNYIFDFEDPDKKEKEKKEALTEVMAKAFKNLVAGLNPAGSPS